VEIFEASYTILNFNVRSQIPALPPKVARKGQSSSTRNSEIARADMIVILTIIQGAIK